MKPALLCCLLVWSLPATAQTTATDAIEPPSEQTAESTAEESTADDSAAATAETNSDPSPESSADAVESSARFAIVLLGDGASALREEADALREQLEAAGLTGVADPALRSALWGQAGEPDDGLGRVRGARRALAISRDSGPLQLIGRATDADALVVLQRGQVARVFDVDAGAFFEAVPVRSFPRFASRAIRAASERQPTEALTIPSAEETAAASEAAEPDAEPEEPPGFLEQNWPYFVAGALLVAGVIWLAVSASSTDEVPPPVLRFRPGD